MQLIKQLKKADKVIEVDKIENRERIEIGTESKKLKEPQEKDEKKILKQIKQEKEREKSKWKGKIIEQERTEQKKSQRSLGKNKIKDKLGKLQAGTEERFQEPE